MRVTSPPTSANRSAAEARAMTCCAPPRVTLSRASAAPSSGVAGMMTAPSFITARMVSQSSTWFPSIITIRSPRATPRARSQLATWLDRAAISANENRCSEPSSSTIHRAGLLLPSAITSNQSSAQLKAPN
jgi:hypothetical protein